MDSSHYPLRARELQHLRGIELYLVYLVRDPHSVVASLSRKDVPERSFGTLASNAYLSLTHLFALPVFLRHPRTRRMFVRHEDLLADPQGVLGDLLAGIDSPARPPDVGALRTGLPLHGNRLVGDEWIAIGGDERKPGKRSPLTTLLQSPWSVVFPLLRPAAGRSSSRGRTPPDAGASPRASSGDR